MELARSRKFFLRLTIEIRVSFLNRGTVLLIIP